MTELEADIVALMRKRVYDMAGVLGKHVKVPRFSRFSHASRHAAPADCDALNGPFRQRPIRIMLLGLRDHCCQFEGSKRGIWVKSLPAAVGAQVYFNSAQLPVKTFQNYCDLYLGDALKGGEQRVYAKVNERWEVCVAPTDGQFQQVLFCAFSFSFSNEKGLMMRCLSTHSKVCLCKALQSWVCKDTWPARTA